MTAKVFRSMKPDASGTAPLVEASARGLGVRPRDLKPCALGFAHPNQGGMSVAPALEKLQPHRVPQRLGHLVEGASGPDADKVWVAGSGTFSNGQFAYGLALNVTSATHARVEPSQRCAFQDYEANLAATARLWTVKET
jgi:hypothetical protein